MLTTPYSLDLNITQFGETSFMNAGSNLTVVTSIPDINGDTLPEIIIGARYASPNGRAEAGSTYLIWGNRSLGHMVDLRAWEMLRIGIRFDGAAAGDSSGRSVASVSDINGDRIPEIVIGASYASPNGRPNAGSAYLIWGNASMETIVDLAAWFSINAGIRYDGAKADDYTGISVAGVADMNGDNIPELLLSAIYAAPRGRTDAGSVYLVWGNPSVAMNVVDLATWNTGNLGIRYDGATAYDNIGYSVAGIPDVNGDKIPEILLGAYYANPQGRTSAGSTYLIWGNSTMSNVVDLARWNSLNVGVRFDGAKGLDRCGGFVTSAPDINGDTIPELLIASIGGSPQGRTTAGSVYLIWGNADLSGIIDLADWTTIKIGVRFDGAVAGDISGFSVASVPDSNRDNISEILIGAYAASLPGKRELGNTYLIWGSRSFRPIIDLIGWKTLNAGVRIDGAMSFDNSGLSVSSVPDFSGDNLSELLIATTVGKIHLIMSEVFQVTTTGSTVTSSLTISKSLPMETPNLSSSVTIITSMASSQDKSISTTPSAVSRQSTAPIIPTNSNNISSPMDATFLTPLLGTIGGVFLLLLLSGCYYYINKKRNGPKPKMKNSVNIEPVPVPVPASELTRIAFESSESSSSSELTDVDHLGGLRLLSSAINLDNELGRGNNSVVYAGTWNGKSVAVKQLGMTIPTKKFVREALSIAKLRSPNLVSFYGVCMDEKPYKLVFEYLRGGSLYQLLQSKEAILWDTQVGIILDIGRGLTYLHSKNEIYRNLKSSNVLLTEKRVAKLSDYGFTTFTSSHPKAASYQEGTKIDVCWPAPELGETGMQHTAQSDVYSYGMIIWEIFAREALNSERIVNTESINQTEEIGRSKIRPDNTPDEIWELIEACCDKDAGQRPSAESVVKKLTVVTETLTNKMVKMGVFHSDSSRHTLDVVDEYTNSNKKKSHSSNSRTNISSSNHKHKV